MVVFPNNYCAFYRANGCSTSVVLIRPSLLWRLELKEDNYRCRQKVLPNLTGSHHLDAVRVSPSSKAEVVSRNVNEASDGAVGLALAVTSAGSEEDPNQSLLEESFAAAELQLSSLELTLTEEGQ